MIAVVYALKVLILAGGLNAEQNHHSHFVHVQQLQQVLAERGVPAADVTVFWADGLDPTPDRAVVSAAPPDDSWLIAGLPIGHRVDPGPDLLNTVFPEAPSEGRTSGAAMVRPASRAALQGYLAEVGPGLGAGDTLLIAVTDHGSPDPEGTSRIELWGGETWNPSELLEDLEPVPDEARVVLWMSQCFSGGFADLFRRRDNLCGAFSTSADRVAYGCHPELAGRPEVGHFMRMAEALGRWGTLAAASDEVMLTDDTPDVPHLTSDALLFGALVERADRAEIELPVFIDTRLTPDAAGERQRAAVALRYGLGSLRDYSATADLLDLLGAAHFAAESFGDAWQRAFDVARGRVVEAVAKQAGEPKSRAEKVAARAKLLGAARAAWDRLPGEDQARVKALQARVEAVAELEARIDLQEAGALRVAWLLGRNAGPAVLDAGERRQLAALQACESKPLFPTVAAVPPVAAGTPVPPAVQIPGAVEALRPGHLGLAFRDRPGFQGVEVQRLLPGSLLLATDLRPGDLVLEVNGQALKERGGFRERVMLAPPGTPLRLVGRRGDDGLVVELPSPPFPLPAPRPLVGDVVGDLRLRPLDRPLPPIGEGRATVLFFWATWCKPCKASLPALRDWATFHEVNVVAITDEAPETVQKFLKGFKNFPFPIALDDEGEAQRLFEVQARPFFVLLDARRRLVEGAEGFTGRIPLAPPPG